MVSYDGMIKKISDRKEVLILIVVDNGLVLKGNESSNPE